MANYGNFNFNKKKKNNKVWSIVIGVFVLILVALFIIGITVGSDTENAENISSAVAENTQLKLQAEELNAQIEEMQEIIDGLKAELEARPTVEPTPYMPENVIATAVPVETVSPRTGRR